MVKVCGVLYMYQNRLVLGQVYNIFGSKWPQNLPQTKLALYL